VDSSDVDVEVAADLVEAAADMVDDAVDAAKSLIWPSVSIDQAELEHESGNHGPMVRIHRTGAIPADLIVTDASLLRKGSDQLRDLEAVLARFVAPVLQEEDIQNLIRISLGSGESTTEPTKGNIGGDEQI
jgi:hypothetical protein